MEAWNSASNALLLASSSSAVQAASRRALASPAAARCAIAITSHVGVTSYRTLTFIGPASISPFGPILICRSAIERVMPFEMRIPDTCVPPGQLALFLPLTGGGVEIVLPSVAHVNQDIPMRY